MLNHFLKLKTKQSQFVALSVVGVVIGLAITGIILNVSVLIRLNGLKKDIQKEKENITVRIEEEVSRTLSDPLFSSGGSPTENGMLVNTKELLSSEQVQAIKDEVTQSCKAYLTDDVYMGLKTLVVEDLQTQIDTIIKEKTSDSFTKEQQAVVSTAVQESVMKQVNKSLNDVKELASSSNKTVKELESHFTVLKGRMDKLDESVNSSINALQEKDRKIESEISELRLSFVSSNTGSSNLNILKVQMATIDTILTEAANTVNYSLDSSNAETKRVYMEKITSYRNRVSEIKNNIASAISNGDKSATEALTAQSASLATEIVDFAQKIEQSKTNISDLISMIQDNSELIKQKSKEINDLESEQELLKAEQDALKRAKETMQQAIDGKISAQEATDAINAIIGDLGEGNTVVAKLAAITKELSDTSEDNKEEAIAVAQEKVSALKTQMEKQAETDRKAVADAKSALSGDIKTAKESLENIIGTVETGSTVMTTLKSTKENLEKSLNDIDEEKSQAIEDLASKTELDVAAAKTDLKTYINSLPDDSALKKQLEAIQSKAEDDTKKAKNDAIAKVDALDGKLATQMKTISDNLDATSKSLQNAIDGKTSVKDVQDEITAQLSSSGSIANALGQTKGILEAALASGDATTLQSAKDALDTESAKLEEKITGNKNKITELNTGITTLNNSVSTISATKADKTQVATDINAAVTNAVSQAETKDTAIKTEAATDATNKANAAITSAVSQAKDDLDEAMEGTVKTEGVVNENGQNVVRFTKQ